MAGYADDVAAWLDKLGLTEYTEKFLAAGYTSLQQCNSLSKDDLMAIGIGKVGHVNRLFRDLERMKADNEIHSPPRSSSSSPVLPAVVKTTEAPAVPPRRTLPRKPKSDGSIVDSPPPPKLLPRKGSLRKSTSAHVIKLQNSNTRSADEEVTSIGLPNSQSLNNICDSPSPELTNEISTGVSRARPPVTPRISRKPVVPPTDRNGQTSSANTLSVVPIPSDKGISPPPVPIRRNTTPVIVEEENTGVVENDGKERTSPPPLPPQRAMLKDEVLRADVPLVDEDDELPPPLPIKKGIVLDQGNNNATTSLVKSIQPRGTVSPDPSTAKEKEMLPLLPSDVEELSLLPVRANEVPSLPVRSTEAPSLPVRATEAPSLPVRANEAPSLPVRSTEAPSLPVRATEAPSLPVRATEAPSPPVRANEAPSLPVRATEAPSLPVRANEAPSLPVRATEAPSLPVRANEAPSLPVRSTEAPSLPVRATEALSLPVRANEVPSLPVRSTEAPSLPVRATEAPSLPVRANEAPSLPVRSTEAPSLPVRATEAPSLPVRANEVTVRAEELPTVSSSTVENSQLSSDKNESSQKPPLSMRTKVNTSSVGDDEVFEEEKLSSVSKDCLPEDEGSSPPLPVKKNKAVVPPPPPPEESDEEECPPLPIKKTVDTSPAVPALPQGEPVVTMPLPPPAQDSSEDDAPPPLPVKKQNKEESASVVHKEENTVPELKPSPLSKVDSGGTISTADDSTVKKDPPVPPRRTVSAVAPPTKLEESDSEDSESPPPPLPEKKQLIPPPPPPISISDTDSEDDDDRFVHKSLVAVKSVPIRDRNDLCGGDIFLSRSKDSMDTSDSSEDDDYHSKETIISQPSLDDDTITLSSTPVTPDDGIGEFNGELAEASDVVPSMLSSQKKRVPPPVKQRINSKLSSPPSLSPGLFTPPPVRAAVPLPPSSIAKSASSDAIAFLSNDSVTSMYSKIELPPEQMKQQDAITSMYSEIGLVPSQQTPQKIESMYSQLGGGVSPQMMRTVNGDLGRPISVEINPDSPDGNIPNRMRSMSELPTKKRTSVKGIHEPTATIVQRPLRRRHDNQSSILSPSASRRGDKNYSQVPKTKEGWLHKRGGKHGDKPWTSRWFTFDGHDLKYFKSSSDKASECLKSIRLGDMIDVKTTTDVNTDKKLCRFDLVATNRVFQLASESQEEVTQWVDVLEAAIKCRSDTGEVEGGSMNNPDKVGFLQKQGHGMIKTWERRYVALKGSRFAYYESKDDFTSGRPINTLEMGLTAVKPDMSGKYRFIITTNRKKEYVFQAVSDTEMREWIEALQKGIMQGLESRTGHNVVPEMNTSSKEIMDRLSKNPSNTTCAECSSTDPVWASVNLGIMLCINCSGVHRSMGTHISKVRSTELDQHIWTDSLIDLIVAIGNKRSNEFWEKHCQQKERLASDVERDIRENFIRAKYELKAWIPREQSTPHEVLNKRLCQAVKTDDVMATLELIVRGANVNFLNTSIKGSNNTPLLIAQEHEQPLQMELLIQNGAMASSDDDDQKDEPVNRQGFLYKTGSERTGWKRRFCSLDKTGFKYYKSDNNSEVLGEFPVEEMLSVNICEDESAKDPHYKYCFEVATAKRPYLFCAEREFELQQWVDAFQKIIPVNAEDILGFDKIGYIYHKTPGGWKRKWCTLRKKDMWFYKRHEKEVIDLRKAIELRGPDPQGNFEAQCSFQIVALGKTHLLKADNVTEADAWYSALKHTQVSGLPLQDQALTNNGIPIIVHKCLQFVESHGIASEGIYRLSGNKTRVQKLILAFDQDAKGFIIDPETYLVNDVAGALKQFFRSLPDPLLTHHLYASFIDAAKIQDEDEKKTQIQSLIERLPPVNQETLKRLIGHLRKVVDNVSVNKMSAANMVRIFGPTLMTVDSDESSFVNANYEFCVIELMFRHYLWMFQIDEIEQRKEEEMQKAMKKLEMAQQMQKQHSMVDSKFLVTVYINSKDGQPFTSKVSQSSTAGDLAEEAARSKALPPDCYALYIVLGNSEAERTLHPTERVLTVMQTIQCDFFFCLKLNLFAERVKFYMSDSSEAVTINLREKKRWRKYPCAVKSNHFVIYRDTKLNHELSRTSVHEFDMFFGTMSDVKNPAPTGHQLYLKARVEDQSKYICADCEEDLLKCAGRIAHAKYPEGFPMPVIPTNPLSEEEISPVMTKPRALSEDNWVDPDIYVNVKLSKKSTKTLGSSTVPPELMRELSTKLKKT